MCATLYNDKRKGRRRACTHTQYCWQEHQIRPRQTTFYGLATSSVHAIHITHQTDTRTDTHLTSGYCVCVQTRHACVSFSSASTERSLSLSLSRPDLGLFLARPPGLRHLQRDTENTMKTGSQFLDDRKKESGRDGLCGFATTVTLGNGLYCNKPYQKEK